MKDRKEERDAVTPKENASGHTNILNEQFQAALNSEAKRVEGALTWISDFDAKYSEEPHQRYNQPSFK